MLFNSLEFLVFFTIVTSVYFLIPFKYRWVLLLASSCYFYMAFVPIYILILGFTIIIDYFAGRYIEKSHGKRKKLFLVFSLIANIGVLAVFKYYNFLNENFSILLHPLGLIKPLPHLNILLPIGLSFHTFQAMSYTIEVYRGRQKAERHFGIYSLYVMFYPQLVAGPIERPQNLLHQFRQNFTFDYDRVTDGLRLMAWGLFKKIVIADRVAIPVDNVYNHPQIHNSLDLIIATIFFAFQIFCDFSGYTDIAIGAARVMGFKLMKNFDKPYHSQSVGEFWKRWHISLSTWFRDYLYISLGGNRVTIPRWYLNIMIVFLISGFWHGANWTFIIWGALHGFYLVFGRATEKIREKANKKLFLANATVLKTITTFALVCFAWIFFRANNLTIALYIAKHIFTGLPEMFSRFTQGSGINTNLGISLSNGILCAALIVFLEIIHLLQTRTDFVYNFKSLPIYLRWTAYFAILAIIVFFGVFENRQFIYFQF